MKPLTFEGYLRQYMTALSLNGSRGFSQLVSEAVSDNPRLIEPVLIFAMITGRRQALSSAIVSAELPGSYSAILDNYDAQTLLAALQNASPDLPDRFIKVYESYKRHRDRHLYENETKALMHRRIKELQAEKGASNYRIYTDLHLNPGNTNAFLKHGDPSKLNMDKTRAILDYLESMQ